MDTINNLVTIDDEQEVLNDDIIQEHKTFIEVRKEAVETLQKERAIVHYISTPDIDLTNDIVEPNGMNDKYYAKNPTVLYNHNPYYPIAKSLWRKKTEDGVLAKTTFSSQPFAQDIYLLHTEGILNAWSIGFIPYIKNGKIDPTSIEYDDTKNIRRFRKWTLLEYSSTPIPANPMALDQMKTFMKSFKSREAQELVEIQTIKVDIAEQLDQYKNILNEIEAIKQQIQIFHELKGELDKIASIEQTLQTLTNAQKYLETELTNKIEIPKVETLDRQKISNIIKSVVGEVSLKNGISNINYKKQ